MENMYNDIAGEVWCTDMMNEEEKDSNERGEYKVIDKGFPH